MQKIECPGCRNTLEWDGSEEITCRYCGEIISNIHTLIEKNLIERLCIAAGYRRVGRFEDSQQELENLLENDPSFTEALFGCFLNAYEVTEYSFDKDNSVKTCKCNTTSRRPVELNKDWLEAKNGSAGKRKKQWIALSELIERTRLKNIEIKNNIPKYRAVLICDYENETDVETADGLFDILSEKTDVFYPRVSLSDVPFVEREKYLVQVLKNPEIAQLMFVVYSDAFNYRNKAKNYFGNIAAQCRDFAKVHTKAELFSVTCDYEPSPMMKTLSIKTIRCKDFDKQSYQKIADKIMENIVFSAYTDDEFSDYENGEIVQLNEEDGLSPKVKYITD